MKRNLALSAVVSIIFFNVCAGPYALEPVMQAGPGLALLLVLLTPLVWAAPVAMACAELGSAIPEEGGYYAWSKRALGPFAAFCQGWSAWMFTLVDMGLYPHMFCDYLANFFPILKHEQDGFWLRKALMVSMIWTLIGLNWRGARIVGGFTKIFGVLVISPFVLMALCGLYVGFTTGFPYHPWQTFVRPELALGAALAAALPNVLWNYQGWDAISTVAGEMNNPRRDYPRALAIATVIIIAVYFTPALIGATFVGVDDPIQWNDGDWPLVGMRVGGRWLAWWVSAMGMASALGLLGSLVLVYSRIPFVIAEDGLLPKVLTRCNARGTPTAALLLCGVLYTVVVLSFHDFDELSKLDVTLFAAVMVMELASFVALRIREPQLPRPFRVPGGWFVAIPLCGLPLLCVSASIYLRAQADGFQSVIGNALVLLAIGPLMYPVLAWRRRRLGEPGE